MVNLSGEPYLKSCGCGCDHQKSKLRTVVGAEDFGVAELRVRQVKIGRKSCFANYQNFSFWRVSQVLAICDCLPAVEAPIAANGL